ncbi:MAG: hypothetical protein J4N73_00120 [Chloroflexi bacterium]|nr:hypothetical protein [Chloroflexota bacterium]
MLISRSLMVAWLSASTLLLPLRQVPGFAEITDPGEGQSVTGIVTVFGTASHPAFESFELAFSFDPDPTDTWFPIGEALSTTVLDGRLAIWDTTGVTDGNYRLRLRVNVEGFAPFEDVIKGIRIRNYTPTEPPPPETLTARPTAVATLIAAPLKEEPAVPEPSDRFSIALRAGIFSGLALMLLTAAYVALAPKVRAYTGYLRIRRLHQRQDRARQRGRRRE